jgi:hypothetical protein
VDIRGFNMDILIWTLQTYTMISHKVMAYYLSNMIWVTWIWYTDSIPQPEFNLEVRWTMHLTVMSASSAFPPDNKCLTR